MQAPKPEQTAKDADSKAGIKSAGKKDKLPEAKTADVADEVLADPVAEKLRQQRLCLCFFTTNCSGLGLRNFLVGSHHINFSV